MIVQTRIDFNLLKLIKIIENCEIVEKEIKLSQILF